MASSNKTQSSDPRPIPVIKYDGVYQYEGTEFDNVKELKCRDSDIWVCSFPRSGTTLTQQTTYLIKTLDFEKAFSVDLDIRFPWIEFRDDSYPYHKGTAYVDSLPESGPRMIKCHLHYQHLPRELLQGKGKIIYIVRDPKASIPSFYRFFKFIKNPLADTLREFLEMFLADKGSCPWGLHIREYWEHRNDENVLFLKFHETIEDRPGTVRKIAAFLGVELTDENVDKIVESTTLESMKNNKSVNFAYFENIFNTDSSEGKFINKGEISGWRKDIPEDLVRLVDEKIEREIGHTDIRFPELFLTCIKRQLSQTA